jgi:hypothetical protein
MGFVAAVIRQCAFILQELKSKVRECSFPSSDVKNTSNAPTRFDQRLDVLGLLGVLVDPFWDARDECSKLRLGVSVRALMLQGVTLMIIGAHGRLV